MILKISIFLMLVCSSFTLKGQEHPIHHNDSVMHKWVRMLDVQSDSLNAKMDSLQLLMDSLTVRDDAILKNIRNDTRIVTREDFQFNEWLRKYGLGIGAFPDTLILDVFELWTREIDSNDPKELVFKAPSKDSSYTLLTNFSREPGTGIQKDLFFRIRDNQKKKNYAGFFMLSEWKFEMLDYYWLDKQTFFLLLRYPEGVFELQKYIVGENKRWIFRTRK